MSDSIQQRRDAAWEARNVLQFFVSACAFNLEHRQRLQEQYPTPRAMKTGAETLRLAKQLSNDAFGKEYGLNNTMLRVRESNANAPEAATPSPGVLPAAASSVGDIAYNRSVKRLNDCRELRHFYEHMLLRTEADRQEYFDTPALDFREVEHIWNAHRALLLEKADGVIAAEDTAVLDVVIRQQERYNRTGVMQTNFAPSSVEQASRVVADAMQDLHGLPQLGAYMQPERGATPGSRDERQSSLFVPVAYGEKDAPEKLAALRTSGFLLGSSGLRQALARSSEFNPARGRNARGSNGL